MRWADLFRRLLSEPELRDLSAGVVLQAYIPDSYRLQRELIAWAIERRRRGGAPIRLRIVKGANLVAELVRASRMGWALPIYPSKHEVDARVALARPAGRTGCFAKSEITLLDRRRADPDRFGFRILMDRDGEVGVQPRGTHAPARSAGRRSHSCASVPRRRPPRWLLQRELAQR